MSEETNKAQTGAQETTTHLSDYTILEGGDASDLSTKVNNLLSRGWEPVGGLAILAGKDGPEEPTFEVWAQAMIKRY